MTRVRISLTTRGVLVAIVAGMGLLLIWTVRSILSPFVWALIVAYIMDPLVRALCTRLRLPRVLATILLFLGLIGGLIWGVVVVRPVLVNEGRELSVALPRILTDAQDYILGRGRIELLGVVIDTASLRDEIARATGEIVPTFGRQAIPLVRRAISLIAHFLLFLIASFYLTLDFHKVGPAIVNWLPRRWRREAIPLLTSTEAVLGSYLRGQVLLIIIMVTASWIALTVLQVRYSLLLAIVTGVLEIFPVIGPWSAGAIAVVVSLTQPTTLFNGNSAYLAAAVAVTYAVLRQLEDIFIIPNVVGKVMELHPLIILFSLTVGGFLGGILGVLIAVPVAAVIKLYLNYLRDRFAEEESALLQERIVGGQGQGAPPGTV